MTEPLLSRRTIEELTARRGAAVDPEALEIARPIVEDVRRRGEAAVRDHAERLGDVERGAPLVRTRRELDAALGAMARADRARLERIASRIEAFARAQLASMAPVTIGIPGGRAGHDVVPVETAGCYAPGGRFPLPSSVLMTAVVARVAGVRDVWVASPRPAPITLAAAAVAGADGVLAAGGAQAIAALAFGAVTPACAVVAGPGNRYVTAAKHLVSGTVRIDLLAGPSELLVVADAGADPALVAADLLAQAEHDTDAVPVLVALDESLPARVEAELARRLETVSSDTVARAALGNGGYVVVRTTGEAVAACDALAFEHVELLVDEPRDLGKRLRHAGALFLGPGAAEVLGDYGAGPNHVLPTGGSARSSAGLSVATFLRLRTWMSVDPGAGARELAEDAAWMARVEGLELHARAAEMRLAPP